MDGIGERDIRRENPEKKEEKKKKKKKGVMKGTLSRALRSVRSMKRARRQQGKASHLANPNLRPIALWSNAR